MSINQLMISRRVPHPELVQVPHLYQPSADVGVFPFCFPSA